MSPRFESVFFASFLFRFGKRNDAPPRAVANRAKEISQDKTREDLKSSNPAFPQTLAGNERDDLKTPWRPGDERNIEGARPAFGKVLIIDG
jgi:hypothetical protein